MGMVREPEAKGDIQSLSYHSTPKTHMYTEVRGQVLSFYSDNGVRGGGKVGWKVQGHLS